MARFSHISGDPVLDLVNTVEWRLGGAQREEDLRTYADVLDWCVESNVLSAKESGALTRAAARDRSRAETELVLVREVREDAYAALLDGDESAARRLGDLHAESLGRARLVREDAAGFVWRDTELDLRTPRDRIARGLVDLLRRDDLDRLHQCEDAVCGWVYLDTSPRRNRRWCVTKDCGDRNRSRAYYARRRASSAT